MRAQDRYTLIAFVLGLCAFGIAVLMMRSSRLEPVSFPVDLQSGKTQSKPFSVSKDAEYLVELEADRKLPFEQLNCLLGISPGAPMPCEGVSPVDLSWEITSSSSAGIVAAGTSRERGSGAWGDAVSRTMGSFAANKGGAYILKVEPTLDGSALMPANPRVVVRLHPLNSKGYAVGAQSLSWFGIATMAGALLWLAFSRARLRHR